MVIETTPQEVEVPAELSAPPPLGTLELERIAIKKN